MPENAVSRKTILEEVWDLREDTDTRAIDNFIVRLRRYLEDEPKNRKFCKPCAASATALSPTPPKIKFIEHLSFNIDRSFLLNAK